jgi:hypothetical protein
VLDCALAAAAGTATLHVTEADDSSSLLQGTDLQTQLFPGTQASSRVEVVTRQLDEVVQPADVRRPALLKIDVQGTELDVLTGASRLLAAMDTVLVECSFAEFYVGQSAAGEVVALLHASSFRLTQVVAATVDGAGTVLQADMVFERPEQAQPSGSVTGHESLLSRGAI